MSAIEQCRTATLGGHVLRCDACAQVADRLQLLPQSALPEVPGQRRARGGSKRDRPICCRLDYYHVVFTLPAPISAIAYYNKAVIYDLLFEVAARDAGHHRRRPEASGAQIGATLVLHTWGSALTHHPHVHGIVPGGGLAPDGARWVACKPGFFLSVRVLSRLFRRRFLEALATAHHNGRLQFFGEFVGLADARAFAAWLAPLRQCEWVVYAKRPFAGPAAVLAYLSRYTHRVAISNQRLHAGRAWRHLPLEGLPGHGQDATQDDDAHSRRVHAPLPAARSARRLPPHSPLWVARESERGILANDTSRTAARTPPPPIRRPLWPR